jgi:hypothetical protein
VVELAANGTPLAVRPAPGAFQLYDVACPSATTCIATGMRRTEVPTYPYSVSTPIFTVITNGQPGPVQRFPRGIPLIVGIACPTGTRCLAVGEQGVAVLTRAESTWTATATSGQSPDGRGRLGFAISCPSPSGCHATATAFVDGVAVPAMMPVTPDGVVGPLQVVFAQSGTLNGISCLADGSCTLVGGDNPSGLGLEVIVKPGSPPASYLWYQSNYFNDVSCLSAFFGTYCLFVGSRPGQAVFGVRT